MNRLWKVLGVVAGLAVVSVWVVPWSAASVVTTSRVSVSTAGVEGNAGSYGDGISADGHLVVFTTASSLVTSDTNGRPDVYVCNLLTGTTSRVSVSSTRAQGSGDSSGYSISADGRFVAFESYASNLVANDTNGALDVFVRDRWTGTTRRVSLSSADVQGNDISYAAAISADGRFVVFQSFASNLVANDSNGTEDVFVRDLSTGTTHRVSVSSAGAQTNDTGDSFDASISGNGRFVAFTSWAWNLVPNDTNGYRDVFVRDRSSGTTRRVSVSSAGAQGKGQSDWASISQDGRFVAFSSDASNLVSHDTNGWYDMFVRDRSKGTTSRVSVSSAGVQGNSISGYLGSPNAISANGRFVAFASDASNLVANDTNGALDVLVRDRWTGTTRRVSVNSAGVQANGGSTSGGISADGRFVVFQSYASNLVANDTNDDPDVFVRGPLH